MVMTRITTRWDGWIGAPGYSNFYVESSPTGTGLDTCATAIKTMLSAWSVYLPTQVTITFIPTVEELNEADGSIVTPDTINTVPAPTVGSSATAFASSTGVAISWRTATVAVRRLMIGRTFIVPLAVAAYQNDGTILDAARNAINNAATTYVNRVAANSAGHPVVWHRNTKGASNGIKAQVTSATVADRTAVLRSRRN